MMNCPCYGIPLSNDTASPAACGAPVSLLSYPPSTGEDGPELPPVSRSSGGPSRPSKKPDRACWPVCVAGIVIGTACLAFGLHTLFAAAGILRTASFTGEEMAAVAALLAALVRGVAVLCVGLGGFMDCYFVLQLTRQRDQKRDQRPLFHP